MKKLTSLLLALLLLATALPALASPTGASPSDIALWQTQVPAPSGEFQKIQAVLGDKAAPVIQQRLDSSQRGAVIDNTPRFAIVIGPNGPELMPIADLFAMFEYPARHWDGNNVIELYDIIHNASTGEYFMYTGVMTRFGGGDPNDFLDANTITLASQIPIYTNDDYLSGKLALGDFFRNAANEIYQFFSTSIPPISTSEMAQYIIPVNK